MRRKEESTEPPPSHRGSEVRRIHIIYFLCRHGNVDHPHLVRLHHLSRNGVRLKDVKRWLGELRGRDVAESYSWSYKRKYKSGYVWQDLGDDDLITPVSDNEYVIKGSEIRSKSNNTRLGKQKCEEASESHSHSSETSVYVSAKEIEEEQSPPSGTSETSTLTDESPEKKDEKTPESRPKRPPLLFSAILTKKTTGGKKLAGSSSNANLIRNLITCGTVKTAESALVPVNDRDKRRIPPPHFLGGFCNDVEAKKNADSSGDGKKVVQGFRTNIRKISPMGRKRTTPPPA